MTYERSSHLQPAAELRAILDKDKAATHFHRYDRFREAPAVVLDPDTGVVLHTTVRNHYCDCGAWKPR